MFLADLTGELRAWPPDTWAKVGVDPDRSPRRSLAAGAMATSPGLRLDELSEEEARALKRPAMTYVRGQLRDRLTARLARVHRRWRHPSSGRRPGDRFLC